MGEKRLFNTLIKLDGGCGRYGKYTYIRGRIAGIQLVICKSEEPGVKGDNGYIIKTKCTAENYSEFKAWVDALYPGLCEFDYQGK